MTYIYALATDRVRYDPYHRLRTHLYEARRGDLTHKHNWLRSVNPKNVRVLILESVTDQEWEHKEEVWINALRTAGCDLVNQAKGGAGVGRHTERTRKLLSERGRAWKGKRCGGRKAGFKLSKETRQKISKAAQSRKAHSMSGKNHSEETKLKIRAAVTASWENRRK